MKNQILSVLTLLMLSLPTLGEAALSDITTEPYKQAIQTLFEKDIVAGYPDGTFGAAKNINRAEFTKIVMGTITTQRERKYCRFVKNFKDVNQNDWFAPYICMAVKKGIIQGYDDDRFRPGSDINFVEAAKILAHTFGGDIKNQENWYDGSVHYLSDGKSIPPTVVALTKNINRGEMAEMLWRIQAKVTTKSSPQFYQGRLVKTTASSPNTSSKKISLDHQQRRVFMSICKKRTKIEPLSKCLNRMILGQLSSKK